MLIHYVTVTCPACGESFEVAAPPLVELPADLDYDCEICCRPMVIHVDGDETGVWAEASGPDD
ncbi:MAG: CPXCG motif-containing cysteine-rich protein [Opitutaceae bacterium]|nr:CPXCG motif-containing cysteine-rich protein [Opitutaceae bacterium]